MKACNGRGTYRVIVALSLVYFGDLHETSVSTLEGINAAFEVLVFLGQLGDVILIDGTKALTSLLVEVAKSLANVLELRCDAAGQLFPLVHLD